ncbi:MAG: hypothetical protein JWL83_3543 [Actinomycetia bacterium]|nr:hypothetical protein [Actinomycetes bacterium]
MEHALALSFARALEPRRDEFVARARRAIELVSDGPATTAVDSPHTVVVLGGGAVERPLGHDISCVLLTKSITTDGRVVDADMIAGSLMHRPDALRAVAPPAAAIVRVRGSEELIAFTDTAGLKQLFWAEGNGVALCATSSTALGALLAAPIDDDAVAAYALLGYHLAGRTAFRGVRKVPRGSRCALRGGRATLTTYDTTPLVETASNDDVTAGVDVVRAAVTACVSAYPDATLELSGGFDSRMVVAAMAQAHRGGRRAFTLASSETENVRIARDVAAHAGLSHTVVDPGDAASLTPEEIVELCDRASRSRDHSANAIDTAGLALVEQQLDQGGRINGQNGEFARGEFYKGLPPRVLDNRVVQRAAIGRLAVFLADWRLLPNRALDPALFTPGFLAAGRAAIIRHVELVLVEHAPHVTRGLDELYLGLRMDRWVGAEFSAAATTRPVLAPFFHPAFIAWARSVPASKKASGKAFARVLVAVDPALAALRLDGRPYAPKDLASADLVSRYRSIAGLVDKARGKAVQRLRHAQKAHAPGRSMAGAVVKYWREHNDALAPLPGQAFVSEGGLAQALEPTSATAAPMSAATVGFMVSVGGALRIRDALGPAPRL